MNSIYKHYIIDLSSNNNFVQIPAMQGDGNSVRGFEIELIQNGVPYIIDREDTLISIMGTKPDTSQIMNPCGLTEEGYILVDITSQMAAVKGRGDYQIVLFGKSTNSQLKSFPFYLLTAPAAFDIDHITSSDEFQALTRNITRTESVIGDASQAISDIRELETSVEAKEASRVRAEEARVQAEERREEAEAARTASENIRKENEDSRQTEEARRQAQEVDRQEEESTRREREHARQEAEAARETAEADRVQTEMDRASAEEIRRENETLRMGNEISRQESEDGRNSAEEARETAEAQRKTAEEARVLQETARQENEAFRQENEASRQEKLAAAVSHAQNAADRAEKAAETADESLGSALEAESASRQSALRAESYARGGTGTREGEDHDNADFYYQQSKALHEDILAAGTKNYDELENKPSLNGIELTGNKRAYDLGLVPFTSQQDLGLGTPKTAIGYVVVNNQIYGQPDGAVYEQAYSDDWFHQIYGDYRTGQIATRGRNNGTWGAWRKQLDDQNYTKLATAFRPQFHFYSTETRTTGYTKVRINPSNNWMISLNVQLYQNYVAHEMLICGYSYGNNHWYQPKAALTSTTDAFTMDVIFGYDADGYLWFAIAAGNYTGLTVCDINNAYIQKEDWSKAVTIEYVPALTGTTQTTVRTCAPTRSQTIKRIEKVSSLPSDAASHPDTLYIIV